MTLLAHEKFTQHEFREAGMKHGNSIQEIDATLRIAVRVKLCRETSPGHYQQTKLGKILARIYLIWPYLCVAVPTVFIAKHIHLLILSVYATFLEFLLFLRRK